MQTTLHAFITNIICNMQFLLTFKYTIYNYVKLRSVLFPIILFRNNVVIIHLYTFIEIFYNIFKHNTTE